MVQNPIEPIEQPSGKNADYENFPVGSWLLPKHLRPHIMVFYAFARAIDDIADSPTLSADEKTSRLDGFARHLDSIIDYEPGYEKATAMRVSLSATGVTTAHCHDLITAFKQDAKQNRYESWDDLLGYCQLSAAPVGRYLIDLHGGCADSYASSDALCAALQVLNHLQDLGDDLAELDRVYMPMAWIRAAHISETDFGLRVCSAGTRQVIDRALDGVDGLLVQAQMVSKNIHSWRLGMEASVILAIAHSLRSKLGRHDPLAGRIVLTKPALALCGMRGILSAII
ncbi:MAG: squalene synthase HpnC [Rhodospirillales bacterium]|jgi:hydroxysqualene synthase|nr:squalene synthase HpnC [Rhodospirillales bacterium]MBT4041696.1 squalene synthase HpnC [Rhodospirillales bacterium]MBT4625817.1 squalene synthase HpnC [Rhodospirillales bacterium]MBT5351675.1 squalene synthase HpnC [Rhodospirillales bacterium]MBT5520381.1 squalene synthase HpnC [Rhodospirillales bacterium]